MKTIISTVFFYLCLSFILGISLGFLHEQGFLFLITFGFGLILIFGYCLLKQFYLKHKTNPVAFASPSSNRVKLGLLSLIVLLMIFSAGGGWNRYNSVANFNPTQADVSYFNNEPQKIKLIGIVNRVEQRAKNNRLIVEVEKIKIGDKEKEVEGRVMAFVHRLVGVNYGDRISLQGQVKNPQPINGFNWPKHLANEGIRSVMFRPWVTIIKKNQGTFIMNQLNSINIFFQERIGRFMPYPQSAILDAMLLGNRGEIPAEISQSFRQIGIYHILSISGLHITIISVIFFWIILGLGLWRKHAFILTSLFLLFYILMIGAPPFAIRAGIMGFLFLLAQYLGRSYSFQNAIIIAATLILIFNPLSLFYDISFQLSFVSILAIFLLFPLLQHYTFQKIKPQTKKMPLLIFFVNTFLISIAILLFLGPLIAYYFGNLPAISPLINLIIIPLLPPLLFFGIISLLISAISLPLSLIFSSIVYLLLSVMIGLSHFFAHLPFIDILQFRLPLYLLITYYIILVIIIFKIKKTIPHFSLVKI